MVSPNHLVRFRQHIRRDCQADLLGGFGVDDQLELLWLLHGNFSRFGAFQNLVDICRTARRASLGRTSLSNSSRLPDRSAPSVDNPVIFPPGRARLVTNPLPTGSGSCKKTMGIVVVASLAARVSVAPVVTITSTLSRTSSAARAGARVKFPSALRYSMMMFFPST